MFYYELQIITRILQIFGEDVDIGHDFNVAFYRYML